MKLDSGNAQRSVDAARTALESAREDLAQLPSSSPLAVAAEACRIALFWNASPFAKATEFRAAIAELLVENEHLRTENAKLDALLLHAEQYARDLQDGAA